ncbi:MAG: M48 family metallopeptidase, partial [Candidatus Omnitrophica bacterium]|nr:M48 family metallopeptidase [Candidatus Omnitrophota bacterium]
IYLIAFQSLGVSRFLQGFLSRHLNGSIAVLPAYLFLFLLGSYLFCLPLHYYGSFIMEHQFGLSRQSFKDWCRDELKSGALSYIFTLIVVSAFIAVVRYYPGGWWIILAVFWILFHLVVARIVPVLIIPLFFKYSRLTDEVLRNRIFTLAQKMNIPHLDCYRIDFSKKSLKGNAALVGWGKARRVLLADTLQNTYSTDEVEVIIAHEFAHYQSKHLLKLIVINSFICLSLFYLIDLTSVSVVAFFGLASIGEVSALPVVFLYFVLFAVVTQPLGNWVSRRFEREADCRALQATGLRQAFISTMEKLASQNLADRDPHPFIKFFFFDHPPLSERILLAQ